MSVSCCLLVDRTTKIQHLNDACRAKVKVFSDDLYQLLVRKLSGSVGICHNGGRLCHADGIGKLDLALLGKSCCHNVLCNITRCISCRTVYLCAVLSGESAAAVTGISAVGIYDDLTSGKTCITVRPSDYKTACGVDKIFGVFI